MGELFTRNNLVAALIMSLMFVRCDHGSPYLTTPWGVTSNDVERFTRFVQSRAYAFSGHEDQP